MKSGVTSLTLETLRQWAAWGGMQNLGYPKKTSFFGERTAKSPLYGAEYMPPEIAEIERAVCSVTPMERMLIIRKYLWHMKYRELGQSLGVSLWTARRRVEEAEYAVHVAYCRLAKTMVNTSQGQKLSASSDTARSFLRKPALI